MKRAQLFAADNARQLQAQLANLAATLQKTSSDAAARLRTLLLAGVLAALVLAAAAAYFQVTRARHERAAREAQEQTRDILKTVREGFFLLDADYRIGSVWSDALTRMFSRSDFAGLSFEELLQGLVSASTLATATKYIKLLWGDRAHENLMKSINPLGQLEITMENGHGGKETRYLQFDFHRVMGPQGIKHVLCSVGDITSSVLLARELHDSQENANAQLDMMLGMMHVDPLQLVSFLDTAETGLKLVNTILKEPARTDAEFRKKLTGLFRELHSIKGEASALNLKSIASRVHALEDMVSDCKKRPELTGNDFLPMVLKLDELLAHLRSVREMASRLTTLKDMPAGFAATGGVPAQAAPAPAPSAVPRARPPRPVEDLAPSLQQMAERLAQDHRKRFRLTLTGLADVPARYSATIKDCLIQMLRNAAVHGIESPNARRAQSKEDVGTVHVDFRRIGETYELVFEDDGAGIAPDTLKAAAIKKQLISEEDAAGMDTRQTMALIFRPGFSTQDDVSMDAGRGVGMDVVARSVYALGGKIGVSTHPGASRASRSSCRCPRRSAARRSPSQPPGTAMSQNNGTAMHGKRSFKLMIVDDSNIMRRRIERSQQFEELEVVGTAGNGFEALEMFKKTDPDVVTMDLTMPRMDGIECIGKLVEMKPAVRILVISALADKATAVEAMEKGANGFLNKPFTDRQLNEAIAELMR